MIGWGIEPSPTSKGCHESQPFGLLSSHNIITNHIIIVNHVTCLGKFCVENLRL